MYEKVCVITFLFSDYILIQYLLVISQGPKMESLFHLYLIPLNYNYR